MYMLNVFSIQTRVRLRQIVKNSMKSENRLLCTFNRITLALHLFGLIVDERRNNKCTSGHHQDGKWVYSFK